MQSHQHLVNHLSLTGQRQTKPPCYFFLKFYMCTPYPHQELLDQCLQILVGNHLVHAKYDDDSFSCYTVLQACRLLYLDTKRLAARLPARVCCACWAKLSGSFEPSRDLLNLICWTAS